MTTTRPGGYEGRKDGIYEETGKEAHSDGGKGRGSGSEESAEAH